MVSRLQTYFREDTPVAPLVSLRVLFGFIMMVSIIRFMANGWVYDLYIKPQVFFPYYGFEWVKPLGGTGIYIVFVLMLLAALGIMLGLYYRLSAAVFFVAFTYVELIDKTNYLNHYYFVSLMSFLLMLVPAHRSFSLDLLRKPQLKLDHVPGWTVGIFRLQLAIVYLFAGLAKLNTEWLLDAMPLRLWLPANSHLPVVGELMGRPWVAYAFSWMGAAYDLFIVFFLLNARTRPWAYSAVVGFHLITWWLFPIGMFPFIMILATLVFFSDAFHKKFIDSLRNVLKRVPVSRSVFKRPVVSYPSFSTRPVLAYVLVAFFAVQVLLPWRYLLYPGHLFWTEQGYRFSWRVMLMEKAGYTIFHVTDPATGRSGDVMPGDYLTPMQEKMMATQPDMILQFAHFLEDELRKKSMADPVITAEAYVTLNGRGSRIFIDPATDLTEEKESFRNKQWIVSFEP